MTKAVVGLLRVLSKLTEVFPIPAVTLITSVLFQFTTTSISPAVTLKSKGKKFDYVFKEKEKV